MMRLSKFVLSNRIFDELKIAICCFLEVLLLIFRLNCFFCCLTSFSFFIKSQLEIMNLLAVLGIWPRISQVWPRG